jgi:hypothetical protein
MAQDTYDNNGKWIGRISTSISNDKTVTINRTANMGTRTTIDRTTGKVTTEKWLGDNPYGN